MSKTTHQAWIDKYDEEIIAIATEARLMSGTVNLGDAEAILPIHLLPEDEARKWLDTAEFWRRIVERRQKLTAIELLRAELKQHVGKGKA